MLSIKQATLDDWGEIKNFIDEAYGPLARYKGFNRWYWQFVTNPFWSDREDAVSVWIAQDGKKVVGQMAVQSARLQIDDKEYAAGWLVDVMILSRYRGQSLGHRLHDAVAAKIGILAMLTMAPATRRIALRANCLSLGPIQQFTKLINLKSETVRRYLHARTAHRPFIQRLAWVGCSVLRVHSLLAMLVNPYLCHLNNRYSQTSELRPIEIMEVDVFSPEIDEFWDRVRRDYTAIFVRNTNFLNWRFTKAPELPYRCFVAKRFGQCVGYVIIRDPLIDELPVGKIVDFLFPPSDHEIMESLIVHAIRVFRGKIDAIDCVTSLPQVEIILKKHGFFATRTVLPTIVCQDPYLRNWINRWAGKWFFTKGDHDWDQVDLAE